MALRSFIEKSLSIYRLPFTELPWNDLHCIYWKFQLSAGNANREYSWLYSGIRIPGRLNGPRWEVQMFNKYRTVSNRSRRPEDRRCVSRLELVISRRYSHRYLRHCPWLVRPLGSCFSSWASEMSCSCFALSWPSTKSSFIRKASLDSQTAAVH